ncbi:MAG: 50S ribosomal protein L3 [Myxococcales bacterium]|nr:50S ribosomal protein L3 [Myxococcales bacterium]
MKALLGKKLGMTRVFKPDGEAVAVTVVAAGPCTVAQLKTPENDGYSAVQLAYDPIEARKLTKPQIGHFAKAGKGTFRILREVRDFGEELAVGAELRADLFAKGDVVDIVGTSKGRGFAGVQKRYGFKGGRATHGSGFHRAPGSIGMRQDPGHTVKGKKMPGHMGDRRITIRNSEIVDVLADRGLLLIKGTVPGARDGLVMIRATR